MMNTQELYDITLKCISRSEKRIEWANDFLNSENPTNRYTLQMQSESGDISLIKKVEGGHNFMGDCVDCEWYALRDANIYAHNINNHDNFNRKCKVSSKIEIAKLVLTKESEILKNHKIILQNLKKKLEIING